MTHSQVFVLQAAKLELKEEETKDVNDRMNDIDQQYEGISERASTRKENLLNSKLVAMHWLVLMLTTRLTSVNECEVNLFKSL